MATLPPAYNASELLNRPVLVPRCKQQGLVVTRFKPSAATNLEYSDIRVNFQHIQAPDPMLCARMDDALATLSERLWSDIQVQYEATNEAAVTNHTTVNSITSLVQLVNSILPTNFKVEQYSQVIGTGNDPRVDHLIVLMQFTGVASGSDLRDPSRATPTPNLSKPTFVEASLSFKSQNVISLLAIEDKKFGSLDWNTWRGDLTGPTPTIPSLRDVQVKTFLPQLFKYVNRYKHRHSVITDGKSFIGVFLDDISLIAPVRPGQPAPTIPGNLRNATAGSARKLMFEGCFRSLELLFGRWQTEGVKGFGGQGFRGPVTFSS